MADLQARQNVLPLSYHVDYWDYIGWKDRFADPRFTERQRYYSSVFGSHTIYTPQMVINGTLDVVGSDHDGVDQAIDAARHRLTSYPITLTRAPDGRLHAALPQAPLRGGAKIWLIAYQSQVVSHADVGENAGRALRSYNVVRSLQMIGRWTGEKMEIALPEVKNVPHDHLALLVNQDQNGQVVAATSFQP
ncbi:MAG TPA: DUF1223 domain-containing protein [Dongiaceae bacterium]|nr:DUF1223 domain-containing protein [Dongiaceae bacterium]